MFKINAVTCAPKTSIVAIEGSIDLSNVAKLKEALDTLFKEGVYKIILDFEKVSFIASAGLGCLLTARDVALKHAGAMVFAGMSSRVREVFDLLGITSLLRFAPDLAGARAQLES